MFLEKIQIFANLVKSEKNTREWCSAVALGIAFHFLSFLWLKWKSLLLTIIMEKWRIDSLHFCVTWCLVFSLLVAEWSFTSGSIYSSFFLQNTLYYRFKKWNVTISWIYWTFGEFANKHRSRFTTWRNRNVELSFNGTTDKLFEVSGNPISCHFLLRPFVGPSFYHTSRFKRISSFG